MPAWELTKVLVLSGLVILLAAGCAGSGSGPRRIRRWVMP
jgi:hypothetical protein